MENGWVMVIALDTDLTLKSVIMLKIPATRRIDCSPARRRSLVKSGTWLLRACKLAERSRSGLYACDEPKSCELTMHD